MMRVTLLAGGVGGAKMAEGLYALPDVDLTVIGNIADDEEFHGLWVSPDIDTLTYTLSGRINRTQGWGVADEGTRALETLRDLGQDTWMTLGDRDLGLHIYRTMRRAKGHRPSDIAADVARAFGLTCRLVLPTDDVVQTQVETANGGLSFQEYFVRERHAVDVRGLTYEGAETARPTSEALHAIATADLIVIAPSNPLLSIAPILAIPGLQDAIEAAHAPVLAVSPLIAGQAVKGPAAALMQMAGMRVDAVGVAGYYGALIDHLVIDRQDAALADQITGPKVHATDIMMHDAADKARLASELLSMVREQAAA
ncbi:MAG: 2-phospho-L-lactate transferase [Pseudomonadota bacterium]